MVVTAKGITLKLEGLPNLKKQLDKQVRDRLRNASKSALYEEAQILRTDAMEHTPVDTNALRSHHYATLPEETGNDIVCEVGTGGPAKEYAVYVHERTELRHKVGEAKWLEKAYNRRAAGFKGRFGKLVRRHYERGGGPPAKAPGVPTTPDEEQSS